MIKFKLIKLLKSIELAGNLCWILALLIYCLSTTNVFAATAASDYLLPREQQLPREQLGLDRSLQTKNSSKASRITGDGQNIIESNANKNIVSNENISLLDAHEEEKIKLSDSLPNNNAVAEASNPIQQQEIVNAPKNDIEGKSEDAAADLSAPVSSNLAKHVADKNNPSKPEAGNRVEKLAVTAKPEEQKMVAPGKAKLKTKKRLTEKSHVAVKPNEGDEQYSSEQPTQELNASLAGSLPNQAGTIFFAENEQIRVALSNRDVNRLAITDDKIQSVNGPAGLYMAKNDPLGSAYIGTNSGKSFTLFVTTVKGHQFSLIVTPIESAGKTVVLTPSSPSRMTAQWEAAEGYQKVIVSLVSSMFNNEPLQDYAYIPAKKSKAYSFYGVAQIKPIGYYLGANLVGSVSVIKNVTREPLSIKPSGFYRLGVRAVALSEQTLPPKASGLIYQVASR